MAARSFLAFALAIPALAQTPSAPQEPLIKITVGVVQVDAVVTDRDGKPVRDLAADDFRIFQDGEERAITNFSWVDTSSAPAPPRPGSPGPRTAEIDRDSVRRTMAVVADDLGMSLRGVNSMRLYLRRLIDEGIGAGDLLAIVRTSAGTSFMSGFTSDRRRLHAALDDLWWRPGATFTPASALPDASALDAFRSAYPGLAGPQTGASSPREFRAERLQAGSLGALQHTIRGMRELPGRKAVLFFSESALLFEPQATVSGRGSVSRSAFDRVALYRIIVDEANRAGVVIYGIDPSGVGGGADLHVGGPSWRVSGSRSLDSAFGGSQGGLEFLARQTGGLFLSNSNDIAGLIQDAMDDMSGYYLLGYKPDSETFNRDFHKIEVEVKRKGLRVRSRKGFYGLEDKDRIPPAPKTRREQLLRALHSPFGASGLDLRATALFALDPEGRPSIQSMTRIDASKLTFTEQDDGLLGIELDVVTAAFDISGQPVDAVDQVFTAKVQPDQLEGVKRRGLLYTTLHPLDKPGAYQFRLVVRDTASKAVGSASQFIETPRFDKKGRLATSGLVVGSAAQLNEAEPASLEGNPAVRVFRPGERIYYWRQILNPKLGKETGQPNLRTRSWLYREGELLLAGEPMAFQPTQMVSKDLAEDIRLYDLPDDLEPGRYILEVETTDGLRKPKQAAVRGWIDFEIR